MTTILLTTLIIAFLVAIIFAPIFIPLLRMLKFGQYIRDEGPKEHQKKAGTPTMGGVIIILAIIVASIYSGVKNGFMTNHLWLLLFVTIAFSAIGFLDDFIKVVMKRNLGLTSKQKLLGQLIVAIIFYIVLVQTHVSTVVTVPGTDWSINFYWAYFILSLVMLLGTSNGTNLTDGLDGLLSGTAAIAFAAYAIIAYNDSIHDVAIFSTAVCGALLGFLVFNAHPAKVFMGDTGSLALGGALAGVAMLTKSEILLVIIGGIFVIETLSVIIQVAYFKATGGKRIFKMSPLHNHYVLSGWNEWRIVSTFWFVGILLSVIGIYLKVWL
ncbi:phospho-N-acetylmuramoyl-pentapeptide-transferase [Pullulanibacillus camelliae]|uniref:Phospho-N-acetylmuramoyl-pentapeptide-transferase n=1 Tax=Pullulanibacillus camelliae TaxID=1707096 RepID=A0A8J2W047_9BACL|nr:phospho-N-acetylmuramoyl-pentapeptide-transferase [Pullulanibacillus camelliae]GGE41347.1 phospho-N-acetylmuramoyl-pentapeptide-transferase [Pullulanibacillus camelliae]